jgi:ATP-dependent Lhr-like helicase
MSSPLPFGPATATWFTRAFAAPTEVQRRGWDAIAAGDDTLLIAPTGSGKTLAAFLVALDRIGRIGRIGRDDDDPPGWKAIYVSPLKALVYDIERNLHAPLRGIEVTAAQLGLSFSVPRIDVRTGDTSQADRRRQSAHPGDILVTTPESLYLLLTSAARTHLRSVRTLIIDEIHALAPTRRGAHLMLSVARLEHLVGAASENPDVPRLQRIGLSATVAPVDEVARFLSVERPVAIIDTHAPPRLDLAIRVPVRDMSRPWLDQVLAEGPPDTLPSGPLLAAARDLTPEERVSIWPAIEPQILDLILAHRATIVFVNARGLAERLAQRLHEAMVAAGLTTPERPLIRAHHGSIAHAQRQEIEDALKNGQLRGIVATSSLELGIDMGSIDLVVQVAAPDSVARGLQRVGRAGHQVGGVSIGRIFPKHRADLAIAAVVAERMLKGQIEPVRIPRHALDVLAQQIVAMVAMDSWTIDEIERLIRRTTNYRELPHELLLATLDMLAGVFPASETADLRPRLNWDRTTDVLTARKGSRLLAVTNGGTIADRGLYGVFLAGTPEGRPVRVGELDEEMVHEARVGETFILGASTWRIAEITRDRVLVTPAPGEPGKLPFWKGEGPGRPVETGRALGAFYRELASKSAGAAETWLSTHYPLDTNARDNLIDFIAQQKASTGVVPSDRSIVVERFRDQLGDWRVCILTPFGARIHAPWALALEEQLGRRLGVEVQSLWTDDGIAMRFADGQAPPTWDELQLLAEDVDGLILERLGESPLFAAMFRENAGRSLLLPRKSPDRRAPLWQQRLRAQQLLAAVRRHARFPIVLETYRTCLQDIFDVPGLKQLLSDIATRRLRVHVADTREASPFSRGIAFAFVQTHMYEMDQPAAERRAQALTLDRALLRELLGDEAERQLFDTAVLQSLQDELFGRVAPFAPTDADRAHDLLRRTCGLRDDELDAALTAGGLDPVARASLREELERGLRAARVRVGGRPLWVAMEDVALFRDAIGALPPLVLPERLALPIERPLETLCMRYAAARVPFAAEALAAHLELPVPLCRETLDRLARDGRLVRGPFHPDIAGETFCEAELLRRIRRRMLARFRSEAAPVALQAWARFLGEWHGLDDRTRGAHRLDEAIGRLEGLALPWSEWERRILPARVPGYRPAMLDAALAEGRLAWVGSGAQGARDGRVMFFRREHVDALLEPATDLPEGAGPLHERLLAFLGARGAAFGHELLVRVGHAVGATTAELGTALWDLVWAGLVTNDTVLPLRALRDGPAGKATSARAAASRGRAVTSDPALAGRWSLVAGLVFEPPSDTVRLVARIQRLVDRWGLVSRDVVEAEGLAGGFAAVHDGLKAMEEQNRIRRGHFVAGLHGVQYALPAIVDRLRTVRGDGPVAEDGVAPSRVRLIAAVDPASPWGLMAAWPDIVSTAPKPKRQAGASVVLRDGEPLFWVAPKGDRLVSFPAAREDDATAMAGLEALQSLVRETFPAGMTVSEVDGLDPRGTRWEQRLRFVGFRSHYKGLTLFPEVLPSAVPKARTERRGFAPPELGYGARTAIAADVAKAGAISASLAEVAETADDTAVEAEDPRLTGLTDRFARRFALRRRR